MVYGWQVITPMSRMLEILPLCSCGEKSPYILHLKKTSFLYSQMLVPLLMIYFIHELNNLNKTLLLMTPLKNNFTIHTCVCNQS